MKLAVIAGSGMGALADLLPASGAVPFDALDGVGACTVHGHAGEIREGRIGGRECLLVLGRRHVYEGEPDRVEHLVAHVARRGAGALLVTSAAGALHRGLHPGELVVVRDLVDRQNRELLSRRAAAGSAKPGAAHPGHRGMTLDPALTRRVERAATTARVAWHRGTLVCGSGPPYETVAEVGALQRAGGDVATMSAAPEVVMANRLGLPVAVVALVTNPCTGVESARPRHDEVLAVGSQAARDLGALLVQLIDII